MTEWSEPETNRMKEMYLAGDTLVTIAKALNKEFGTVRSRNSISGRLDRLKVPRRPRPEKVVRDKPERKHKFHNDGEIRKPKEIVLRDDDGITIHELNNSTCRYIVSDVRKLYCGKQIARGPYCQGHSGICYQSSVQVVQIDPSLAKV